MKFFNLINRNKGGRNVSILHLFYFAFAISIGVMLLSADNSSFDFSGFESDPPTVKRIDIQKVATNEIVDGKNLIIRIRYEYDLPLPTQMTFNHGNLKMDIFDNGEYPDLTANDKIYPSTIKEDIPKLLTYISRREYDFAQKGYLIKFDGHDGKVITDIEHFDVTAFNNGNSVILPMNAITAADCDNQILKENSLLITDLAVVEDLARTFNTKAEVLNPGGSNPNLPQPGNPLGIYTFGNLMKNMANEPSTGVSTKQFLKQWVRSFVWDYTNSSNFNMRGDAMKYLISPWINRALGHTTISTNCSADPNNINFWEPIWDQCTESDLLKWAPFRLSAIANRLDLRGNNYYGSSIKNAGETRFIFSLVCLYEDNSQGMVLGNVPKQVNQIIPVSNSNFVDWEGMNIIFEYQNIQTDLCQLQSFAQKWLDLSQYTTIGTSANDKFGANYRTDLEAIASTVITNTNIGGKPNGSAIGRIRTNEKLLQFMQSNTVPQWASAAWQFKQFEIDPTSHLLTQVNLNNTPSLGNWTQYNLLPTGTDISTRTSSQIGNEALTDWAYTPFNKTRILQERHKIPATYAWTNNLSITQTATFLSDNAFVTQEYVHYLDLEYFDSHNNGGSTMVNFNPITQTNYVNNVGNRVIEKELRHKLSLNTCQGCHSGENKTFFTQIMPLGYGESAKYWDENNPPDSKNRVLDTRTGNTQNVVDPNKNNHLTSHNNTTYNNYSTPQSGSDTYPIVSAFLTGRRFMNGSYQDDLIDPNNADNINLPLNNLYDSKLTGLFYVNDPSNDENGTNNILKSNTSQWSFNELNRRRDDLCMFLQASCVHIADQPTNPDVITLAQSLAFSPLFE